MPRSPSYLLPCVAGLACLSLAVLLLYKVDDFAAQTKTVVGHNLQPTPWHLFPPKTFSEESRHSRIYKILHCSYLTCSSYAADTKRHRYEPDSTAHKCPEFFRWIHQDLEPWARTGISAAHLKEARKFAAFRAVIVGGRLFVDLYYACVQSRAAFTIWGLLQLLRRYPGMVPDVDMVFDCMDKPSINRTEHGSLPLPLFRYCTTQSHFDIPFPDWSFWGWPETNLNPWDEEFREIKRGSQRTSWTKKHPRAYWKGNPDVDSPVRTQLLKCNHSRLWGAQIWRQNWGEEAKGGYENSKLSNQCNSRYKIYAEGYAWSARAIAKGGQEFMESLSMNRIYDYMFHLINEYSKLQKFKPVRPSSSLEVCAESLLCLADPKQRKLLERSTAHPSPSPPCSLQPADSDLLKNWVQHRRKTIKDIEDMKLIPYKDIKS
ncbi:hypothetical protein TIFTF001_000240 [Ficus carica]|uniref:Glycosyl transferase CAP10 domain-containing protein n=1 Tax=Ficus carica TaxID=3494 RepID=A0AA87Z241_FICCA|nr:hypothetical protein TIFTF001_000240 [Ficus carica]